MGKITKNEFKIIARKMREIVFGMNDPEAIGMVSSYDDECIQIRVEGARKTVSRTFNRQTWKWNDDA